MKEVVEAAITQSCQSLSRLASAPLKDWPSIFAHWPFPEQRCYLLLPDADGSRWQARLAFAADPQLFALREPLLHFERAVESVALALPSCWREQNQHPRQSEERDAHASSASASAEGSEINQTSAFSVDQPLINHCLALGEPAKPVSNSGHWRALPLWQQQQLAGLLVCHSDISLSEQRATAVSLLAHWVMQQVFFHAQRLQLSDANQWIQKELNAISSIQQSLLPDLNGDWQEIDVAVKFQAYKYAGGDYYDIADLSSYLVPPGSDGRAWGAMIADVSGHGPGAAVEAAMFDAILRTYGGEDGYTPAGVLTYANRHFFSRRSRGNILSAIATSYLPQQSLLVYANAGHPPALLKRTDQPVLVLDSSEDIPLGVMNDYRWQNYSVTIEPGDVLLLYTDGVVEAENAAEQPFGIERVSQLLEQHAHKRAQEVVDAIDLALAEHLDGKSIDDDQTLIAIKLLK